MAKKQKDFKTFEQWHRDDVTRMLGVRFKPADEQFKKWIAVEPAIPPAFQEQVEIYRQDLFYKHESWNETELMARFIVPFLMTVAWRNENYDLFNQRPLEAAVKGYSVHGIVDGMVASGSYEPGKPYFFLHEYKRMKAGDADPLGQLLIAMLAAQSLNNDGKPIYGCYMIGTYWRFILLEGDFYSQSQGYDLTDETEIQIVWAILKRTKDYIEIRVKEDIAAGIIK